MPKTTVPLDSAPFDSAFINQPEASSSPKRSNVRSCNKFVLLVDDDPADLYLFKRLLEKADFKVIATTQTDTAIAAIVAGEVGCLVTDQIMAVSRHSIPDTDKRELIRVFRQHCVSPVLALRRQGENAPDGADEHAYPQDIEGMLNKVSAILKRQKAKKSS